MGRELPVAGPQPLQPVRIQDGKVTLFAGPISDRFSGGTGVGLRLHGNHIHLDEVPDGQPVPKAHPYDESKQVDLELPREAESILPEDESLICMLVHRDDYIELLPIRVQEHEPDVLGPRIIDELADPTGDPDAPAFVRHLVRGHEYHELTAERLQELEDLICARPLPQNPLEGLVAGDDWVAWKTRAGILGRPAPDDGRLRERLVAEAFAAQSDNGSWSDSVMGTAYGILRALSLGVPPGDERVGNAAQWLLNWPEPAGRPGMWMQSRRHLSEWNAIKTGEVQSDRDSYLEDTIGEEDCRFVRHEEQQQVLPTCARHYTGLCDAMLHASGTVAHALCLCGCADHPRVRSYANSILQIPGLFGMCGYFCTCWGPVDFGLDLKPREDAPVGFSERTKDYEVALKSLPYGYARDAADLRALARRPYGRGIKRPYLADTHGWVPYDWRDIGVSDHFAIVGTYWQNADCWAKTNRGLSAFPEWPGSISEFHAVFQAHLYQTSLGEWNQGFPAGMLALLSEVTRLTRAKHSVEDAPVLRFAKAILLKSVPWLREHQEEDTLWHHEDLSRLHSGESYAPPSPRLATYHIVSALNDFALLDRLLPRARGGPQ